MPGITKRKYVGEFVRYSHQMQPIMNQIKKILPQQYNAGTLLKYFTTYYPAEWNDLVGMCTQYSAKDDFLKSVHKKPRYSPPAPRDCFFKFPAVKRLLCASTKDAHFQSYNAMERETAFAAFEKNRKSKIKSQKAKLHSLQAYMHLFFLQKIEPLYADDFIRYYHHRGCTTAEKLEIAIELAKFDCPKVETFFYKLNDAERNDQLRHWAFRYLQARGKYVKLRKQFKGKKKAYVKETADFTVTPQDLLTRFSSTSVQNMMRFDVFVSHSIKNRADVKRIIDDLNQKHGLTCYCDWGVDNEFLQRDAVGEATRKALERRLRQSRAFLLVNSAASSASPWVEWEINYFKTLNKPMYYTSLGKQPSPSGFRPIADLFSAISRPATTSAISPKAIGGSKYGTSRYSNEGN